MLFQFCLCKLYLLFIYIFQVLKYVAYIFPPFILSLLFWFCSYPFIEVLTSELKANFRDEFLQMFVNLVVSNLKQKGTAGIIIKYIEFQDEKKVAPNSPMLLTNDIVSEFVSETRPGGKNSFPPHMEEFGLFFEKSLTPNPESLKLFRQYAVRFLTERRQTRNTMHPLQSLAQTVASCPRLFSKLARADIQV
jgi:hypothetical protein